MLRRHRGRRGGDLLAPLSGFRVLDLSNLLPGPMASLILAEAGAEVTKVEMPGQGDDMRRIGPPIEGRDGRVSAYFVLLNRGKNSLPLDLKADGDRARLWTLIEQSDVVLEQFRPGVMDRLGFGWKEVRARAPQVVYCSITGYGQSGPDRQLAGHDLNYLARSGVASLVAGPRNRPAIPPTPIADLAGGAYPAVMNIVLALLERERTGRGCHLDVAMSENLFPLAYWGLGIVAATGEDPVPEGELMSGGSPRNDFYETKDGRWIAVCALEEKFWTVLCDAVGIRTGEPGEAPEQVRDRLAAALAGRTAEEWRARFAGLDVCCEVVAGLSEAMENPHFRARGLFRQETGAEGVEIMRLPTPLAPALRSERPEDKGGPSASRDGSSDRGRAV